MQITGRITKALEPRQGTSAKTGKSWFTQDFLIEEEGNRFNNSLLFTVFGEDKAKAFNIIVGSLYAVDFDISVHEYKDRYFNELKAFNVTPLENKTDATTTATSGQQPPSSAYLKPGATIPPPPLDIKQPDDQLPF